MKNAVGTVVCIALLLLASCGESGYPAPEAVRSPTQTPVPPTATSDAPTDTALPAVSPLTTTPVPEATPSSPAEAGTDAIEVTRKIPYTSVGGRDIELDVYAPSESGRWPVVVAVHGLFGKRLDLAVLSRSIATQRAVVYNIDVWHLAPELDSAFERIACAVRFARETATDYGGDPGWIALVGHSLGAHNAAVIALAGDDFHGECAVADSSAEVDAFIGYEGPYDVTTTFYHSDLDYANMKDNDPERWHALNPYSHIGRNPELQVRLIHGDAEDVAWSDVPLEASMELHQALADAGYDAELLVLEGAEHFYGPDAIAVTVEQVMELARSSSE